MKLVFGFFICCYWQFAYSIDNETFRFNRCFAQFTRTLISTKNAIRLQVEKKEISGADACIKLIDSSTLGADGKFENTEYPSPEIIRTFQSFHRGWFKSYNLNVLTPDYAVTDFYDSNEMGYHVTAALFSERYPISNILTTSATLKGVRHSETLPKLIYDDQLGVSTSRNRQWTRGDDFEWKPDLILFGLLKGIVKQSPNSNNLLKMQLRPDLNIEVDPDKNFGGGVLGSTTYLLLNSGQLNGPMDGGLKVHRRWSKAVFEDLLCRELPVIEPQDADSYVETKSMIPFRKNVKCMHCHASMDPMAGVIRNVELFNTSQILTKNIVRGVYTHSVNSGSEDYFEQKPKGKLYFRNYKNELISNEVSSLSDLGNRLSQTEDFYVCVAKRYFHFLTGNDVLIKQRVDMTPQQIEQRNFVIEKAISLKQHQSLKTLIHDIVDSNFYLERY